MAGRLGKALSLLLSLTIIAVMVGCSGTAGEPTADEVVNKVLAAQAKIRSYRLEMYVTTDIDGQFDSERLDETMWIDASCVIDQANNQMEATMRVETESDGERDVTETITYLMGDNVYVGHAFPGQEPTWTEAEVWEDFWETQDTIDQQLELLRGAEVKRLRDERVEGTDCYVLEITPHFDQFWQMATQYTLVFGMTAPDPEEVIKEVSIRQWIAKDTFFLVRGEIQMTVHLTSEALGMPEDEGQVTSRMDMYVVAYDYNEPVSIELPPEVDGEVDGEGTFNIGLITDLTGPASVEMVPLAQALMDLVRYVNEEDPMPDVEIKVITYDTRSDPARGVPGYDWLKERGAKLLFSPLPMVGELLKPFVERERIPLLMTCGSYPLVDPPGWAFCSVSPVSYQINCLLRWISEEHWDYVEGAPKIGLVGWYDATTVELETAISEYCQAGTDEFDYVGGFLAPMGTVVWDAQVELLKECDYVCIPQTGVASATFVKEFRENGYTATFIGTDTLSAFQGMLVGTCGWEALDGMLTVDSTLWWDADHPLVGLAKELLHRYDPMGAEDMIYSGSSYVSGIQQAYFFLDILRAAIEQVGAENFTGQAFYDTAVAFETTYEGLPEWGFTETIRYASKHVAVYEWTAEWEELTRVSPWLPVG